MKLKNFYYASLTCYSICNKTYHGNGKLLVYSEILKRNSSSQVRVRFAPSPTGFLHLGGLRTALYNYLFAKSKKGTFILRIEDTDQSRLVPDVVERIQEDMLRIGIIADEGPTEGGDFGPYIQSERLEIYREHLNILLENGFAYPCFCSEHRLNLIRKEAIRRNQVPKYDNRCRHLKPDEISTYLQKGIEPCFRFKLPDETQSFNDIIFGPINYNIRNNEGDFVIVKGDHFPTYHFANVVDDHLMKVSHVLRGAEWQISTTKHILLYKAFGWIPPTYGHLPLILNQDGSKLSKRQRDIDINSYLCDGYFPNAIINYIMSAGGGFNAKFELDRIYTLSELVRLFNIKKMNSVSCKLNEDLLDKFNVLELKRQMKDEDMFSNLILEVKQMVLETYKARDVEAKIQMSNDHVRDILIWSQNRIKKLNDLVSKEFEFLWSLPTDLNLRHWNKRYNCKDILISAKLYLHDINNDMFTRENLKGKLQEIAKQNNVASPDLMKFLRYVLCGLKDGPSVAEMMEILGKENILWRIDEAMSMLEREAIQGEFL